eukprot:6207985-Pleurochrysis_carterae.AAC.2
MASEAYPGTRLPTSPSTADQSCRGLLPGRSCRQRSGRRPRCPSAWPRHASRQRGPAGSPAGGRSAPSRGCSETRATPRRSPSRRLRRRTQPRVRRSPQNSSWTRLRRQSPLQAPLAALQRLSEAAVWAAGRASMEAELSFGFDATHLSFGSRQTSHSHPWCRQLNRSLRVRSHQSLYGPPFHQAKKKNGSDQPPALALGGARSESPPALLAYVFQVPVTLSESSGSSPAGNGAAWLPLPFLSIKATRAPTSSADSSARLSLPLSFSSTRLRPSLVSSALLAPYMHKLRHAQLTFGTDATLTFISDTSPPSSLCTTAALPCELKLSPVSRACSCSSGPSPASRVCAAPCVSSGVRDGAADFAAAAEEEENSAKKRGHSNRGSTGHSNRAGALLSI